MQYRRFGPTGLEVSVIGLGGMPLSIRAERPAEEEAISVILHAYACGVTFWDTADSYCLDQSEFGHNERLFGKALKRLAPADQHA